MRILLVSPARNYPMGTGQYPSGALLLLGAILKKESNVVKVVHMAADRVSIADFTSMLKDFNPDLVGFTVSTYQTKFTRILSNIVKTFDRKVVTVAGGLHPSALKSEFLVMFPDIDVVVYGEGEHAIVSMSKGVPLSRIKGICYRDNGIVINPLEPMLQTAELNSLPMPDRTLINFKRYSGLFPVGRRPCMFIQSSRGCPWHCEFCSKSIYGNTLRLRSPDNVMEEIEILHKDWGVREVHLSDDTFNANLDWAHNLLDRIITKGYNKKLVFRVALRVNEKILDRELLEHLKAAGVWFIYYGVENGNQGMLDRMGKGITITEIKRAFKLTREVGIRTEAFFIIGMPGETVQTIQDSYNLYREIKPWWGGFSKAMPFPGTPFTQEVKARGHLLCDNYDLFNPSDMMVRTDALTADELNKWTDIMNRMTRKSKIINPKQMMYLAIDQVKSVVEEKIWTKPGGSI